MTSLHARVAAILAGDLRPDIRDVIEELVRDLDDANQRGDEWRRMMFVSLSNNLKLEVERDALAAQVEELSHQMMTVQTSSEYDLGHEHGSLVAVKYKAERDALAARLDAAEKDAKNLRTIVKAADDLFGRVARDNPKWRDCAGHPPASTGHILYNGLSRYEKVRALHAAAVAMRSGEGT